MLVADHQVITDRADPTVVRDLLRRGNDRATSLADATLDRVREAMRMT